MRLLLAKGGVSEFRLFSAAVLCCAMASLCTLRAHNAVLGLFFPQASELASVAFGLFIVALWIAAICLTVHRIEALFVSWAAFKGAVVAFAIAALLPACVALFSHGQVLSDTQKFQSSLSMALLLLLLSGAAIEEFLLRGVLYWLQQEVLNTSIAAILFWQGLFFALWHAPALLLASAFPLISVDWAAIAGLNYFLGGVVLTLVRANLGTVYASTAAHFGWNVGLSLFGPGVQFSSLAISTAVLLVALAVLLPRALAAERSARGKPPS
jgi:membrane protease YdiL (CAAX protease family)